MIERFVLVLMLSCSCGSMSFAGQTVIPDYEEARRIFWRHLYADGGTTLYCGKQFGSGYNRGINIEHVFPMGWVTHALDCGRRKECRYTSDRFNQIEADLHNLYPALTEVNDARGSMRFGFVNGEKQWQGGCDFEVDERRRVVEPAPDSRGNIARSMFYMKETYGMVIFGELGRLLQDWNRQDPVSDHERDRNDTIERLQGTRNVFIDNPRLADSLKF